VTPALRTRLLTAAVLVPLVLLAVLYLPTWAFELLVSAIMLGGFWEWTRIARLPGRPLRALATAALAAAFLALAWQPIRVLLPVAGVACVFWALAALWLSRPDFAAADTIGARLLKLAAGIMVLGGGWAGAVFLRDGLERGPMWLLMCLVVVYGSDSLAYFSGRHFGGAKLAPRISPAKTWAGFWGAVAGTVPVALVGGWLMGLPAGRLLPWMALAAVCVLLAVLGDLFESLMKRHAQVKDSGRLFPGHGGLLDRGDSMFAALPAFAVGLAWLPA
jgi:phosphatidate cytidylyltransferase